MKLIVISGVSGSGKSTALNLLEDLGYYCIDNLPVGLLPALAEQMQDTQNESVNHIAVGIDARNLPGDLHLFPSIIEQLKSQGISCETMFLDADDTILLKRFSETRRKHPLSIDAVPLIEAIKGERMLLDPITSSPNIYIDTTHTNLYQLRDLIREKLEDNVTQTISVLIKSFGFKHGVPSDTDFIFDVRCLPNPHWEQKLRSFTGKDQPVIEFLQEQPPVNEMFDDIYQYIHKWLPSFDEGNRSYITISIGCTGGQHRSVYLAERLASKLKKEHQNVSIRHRDAL